MARFPETEPQIAALAMRIAQGLSAAREDFPSPPVSGQELQAQLDAFHADQAAVVAAKARTRELTATKKKSLKSLTASMKAILRYSEIMARKDPKRLTMLGWGPPKAPTALTAPGEVRDIAIRKEGDTWLLLAWKAPRKGGEVAAYQVQRRTGGKPWEDVATSTETQQLLNHQPRGAELEFRVMALNRVGSSPPSATVTAVL